MVYLLLLLLVRKPPLSTKSVSFMRRNTCCCFFIFDFLCFLFGLENLGIPFHGNIRKPFHSIKDHPRARFRNPERHIGICSSIFTVTTIIVSYYTIHHLTTPPPFTSMDQVLRLRGPSVAPEFDKERTLLTVLDSEPELESEPEARFPPKQANKLRKIRLNPPLSLPLLPLEDHDILLGRPPLLNPPSISV